MYAEEVLSITQFMICGTLITGKMLPMEDLVSAAVHAGDNK